MDSRPPDARPPDPRPGPVLARGITLEPARRPASTLVTVTGELDLSGYGFLRDGLLEVAADGPPGLIADVGGLTIGELAPATVFPLVARRLGHWPGIPFAVVTRQRDHLRTFRRHGTDRHVAVHDDVETAERHQEIPARRSARQEFPQTVEAATLARGFLRECTTDWGVPGLTYDGLLVVGELVDNALQHTRSAPDVRLDLRGKLLTIAVADDNPRPAVLLERPGLRDPGIGLQIVAQTARRWGSSTRWSGGKVVWATLAPAANPRPGTDDG
ncbi:ATP-binding protein [Amycolatopsis sp. FBCC-B4732]|uniref:ATP-binding protein n=1 Tax=Amycolatopsis sp. FBCC-B4732 TaxID=3079339 RepID=UPI001FF6205F|nr:ATP-binding protein [Amycolatopsis sp. FBCC-B4732]UOX85871.1 ATP-binding protein [Amycolatopsis sp. FBCC-B4732]